MTCAFITIAWSKMQLYSILENVPTDSFIYVVNAKWMNSDIQSNLFCSSNIQVIDSNNIEESIEILNTIMKSGLTESTSKITLIYPHKAPIFSKLYCALRQIQSRNIYIDAEYIIFAYDKNIIIPNVTFRDTQNIYMLFHTYAMDLMNNINYKIISDTQNINHTDTHSKKINKYTFLVSNRNTTLLNEIKNSGACSYLHSINFGKNNFSLKLFSLIKDFTDDYFVIVNHKSSSIYKCLAALKNLENISESTTISYDDNEIYIYNKNDFLKLNITNYYTDIEVLTQLRNNALNTVSVHEKTELKSSVLDRNNTNSKFFLFILPFMYNGDRMPLFKTTLKNLRYQLNNSTIEGDILIHECGKKQMLDNEFISQNSLQYIFNEYTNVFNRAWCFNVAARYCNLPSNKEVYFIFMDSDILVDQNWIDSLKYINDNACIGWNKLYDISNECTQNIVEHNYPIPFDTLKNSNIRYPSVEGACGRCNYNKKECVFWS